MNPNNESTATLTTAKHPRIASVAMVIGASLVLLVPAADNYHDTRASRIALEQESDSQGDRAELQKLKLNLNQVQAANQEWQRRAVAPEFALEFQNELIAIARGLKCRVRHASLGRPHRKPWKDGDDPFEEAQWAANRPNVGGRKATQVLAIQSMKLTLEGSYSTCQKFISTLQSMRRLVAVKSLGFHPPAANRELIQLDIELMMFTIEAPASKPRESRVDA